VRHGFIAAAVAALCVAAAAPAAAAAVRRATSSNWAGYAVSRTGTTFRRVSATWVQPTVSCTAPVRASVAYWVGLGGLHTSSRALEQAGTEGDCDRNGVVHYSAWYELVPAGSVRVHLAVRPGDQIFASVTVAGHAVQLALADRTTGATFSKTLRAATLDTTSVEWIAEAPSVCDAAGRCFIQPLAAFDPVSFAGARATSTALHAGWITDAAWSATAIDLSAGEGPPLGRRFAAPVAGAGATTGDLNASGDAFTITAATPTPTPTLTPTGS
jgi:hypothetical protein